jgi:hypothetical protein
MIVNLFFVLVVCLQTLFYLHYPSIILKLQNLFDSPDSAKQKPITQTTQKQSQQPKLKIIQQMHQSSKQKSTVIQHVENLIRMSNPKLDSKWIHILSITFVRTSQQFDIPLEILLAIAYHESRFQPYVTHPKTKCFGIMQVNTKVWSKIFPKTSMHNKP